TVRSHTRRDIQRSSRRNVRQCCNQYLRDISADCEWSGPRAINGRRSRGVPELNDVFLRPGHVSLAEWRAIHRGAGVALDRASSSPIEGGAAAVAAIIARGEPVYGINTGFGKLASVRIGASDLATLQRNIVLSHAAGVGAPMPPANARLMMALKLASLAQ